jgi:hypothetical protein
MSKLGNVYELDFNTRMKNKYPVVYINDEYIVCKCNGTNIPKIFKRNDGSIYTYGEVLDCAIFKAMDNPLEYRKFYIIYVPQRTNETFSEFFVQSEAEKELEKAQKLLNIATWNLNRFIKELDEIQNKITQAQKNVVDRQMMVDKYKKIVAEKVLNKNE